MVKKFFLIIQFLILFSSVSFAAPSEIILLRHADKLDQKETGPALSATGYVRAINFTFYFLKTFGEPDFIVAGKPKGKNASIRELQTIAPMVTLLSAKYPETGFNILHSRTHKEFAELADDILKNKKFDNKLVLICWRHTKINELAKALGVKEELKQWPDRDFDSVYVIKFNKSGKVNQFSVLHDQYPVNSNVSWEDIAYEFRRF